MKLLLPVVLLSFSLTLFSQTVLTHNIGTTLVETSIYTCSNGGIEWGRDFVLADFGIDTNEEFIITRGEVGFSAVGVYDVNIGFNIYEIDNDFPASFSRDKLIGSSEIIRIFQSGFQLVTLEFTDPVVVPSNIERILVEVRQEYSTSSAVTFIAGTAQDNDISWFNTPNGGCAPESYVSTVDLGRPDARFYINVTGTEILAVDNQIESSFIIYPNPVTETLFIKNGSQVNSVEVLNLHGVLMNIETGSNRIDVSQLASGVYFARIWQNNQVSVQKFIKE